MKTILLALVFAATPSPQPNEWTPLAATEGAVVTLEKPQPLPPAPAPKPDPDGAGAKVGGPIDTFREAKALIDKGNALADRSKAILDQAQRDGKITLDIRLPTPPNSPAQATCPPDGFCPSGTCPMLAPQWTSPAGKPQTQSTTGGRCPGGACPVPAPATEASTPGTVTADTTPRCTGGVCQPRRLPGRWRR